MRKLMTVVIVLYAITMFSFFTQLNDFENKIKINEQNQLINSVGLTIGSVVHIRNNTGNWQGSGLGYIFWSFQ